MPIDADVAGGYGSPGNRPNDPRGPGGKDPGGPEKDKDENKTTDFSGLGLTFGDDGKLVTFGQDKTPVGLTQKYFSNNPQNIQPAYDAGLMNTGVASLFSGQGLLNTKPLTNANTNINPNIITIGNITVTKFGIKNIDRYNIVKISTCIKFVNETNLVNCNNQDIDKKIKRMNKHPFKISKNIYLSILFIIM